MSFIALLVIPWVDLLALAYSIFVLMIEHTTLDAPEFFTLGKWCYTADIHPVIYYTVLDLNGIT